MGGLNLYKYAEPKNSRPQGFGYKTCGKLRCTSDGSAHPRGRVAAQSHSKKSKKNQQHSQRQLLVFVQSTENTNATRPNCGKSLRAWWYQATVERSWWRTSEVRYGKNPQDWVIRSQAPTAVMMRPWRRFRGHMEVGLRGLVNLSDGLRYGPAPWETLGNTLGIQQLDGLQHYHHLQRTSYNNKNDIVGSGLHFHIFCGISRSHCMNCCQLHAWILRKLPMTL